MRRWRSSAPRSESRQAAARGERHLTITSAHSETPGAGQVSMHPGTGPCTSTASSRCRQLFGPSTREPRRDAPHGHVARDLPLGVPVSRAQSLNVLSRVPGGPRGNQPLDEHSAHGALRMGAHEGSRRLLVAVASEPMDEDLGWEEPASGELLNPISSYTAGSSLQTRRASRSPSLGASPTPKPRTLKRARERRECLLER